MDTMNPMKLVDPRTRIEFSANGDTAQVKSYGKGNDLLLLLAICTYSMIRQMCLGDKAQIEELMTHYVKLLGTVSAPSDCITIDLKEAMRQKGNEK